VVRWVFGRTAASVAISGLPVRRRPAIISEIPFDIERLTGMLLADKANPSGYAMMTISEGAPCGGDGAGR
jgi:hypothetical protein